MTSQLLKNSRQAPENPTIMVFVFGSVLGQFNYCRVVRASIIYLVVMAALILVPAGFILLSLHWCEAGYAAWCFLAPP